MNERFVPFRAELEYETEGENTVIPTVQDVLAELKTANEHLAEVGRESNAFRERIVVTMKESAAKGAFNCSLDEIGDELNNLWASKRTLTAQLAQERDDRAALIAAGCVEFTRKASELSGDLELALHEVNTLKADLAKAQMDRDQDATSFIVARKEVEQHAATIGEATKLMLAVFLGRPARVLEIFGPDAYQCARDLFTQCGGDARALPLPVEPKPVEGDGDAD